MPGDEERNRDPDYAVIREYKSRVLSREAKRRYGAHSVGIARKVVNGRRTSQLALTFYVTSKRPQDRLAPTEAIPPELRFRGRDGRERLVITDVVEMPPVTFVQAVDPETRIRPVPGGVSGGIAGSTGTIGGWVWDETDDSIVLLSNEHVLGTAAGTDILQQGTADGGSLPADKIGEVKRGIPRVIPGINIIDAAIGDPDNSNIYDLSVLEIGPAVYAVDVPAEHMLVEKYGQTTRHTFGEIIDLDLEPTVDGLYDFDDCLLIEPVSPSTAFVDDGDSGSLIFSQTPIMEESEIKPVVGLVFAKGGVYGAGCKIQNVFSALNLTTLCAGAFAGFLDSLAEESSVEEEPAVAGGIEIATRRGPAPFAARERRLFGAHRLMRGYARDVQGVVLGSRRGRDLDTVISAHRAELLSLLATNGDVRRATVAALRPLMSGAVTTRDLLARVVTGEDVERMSRLASEVEQRSTRDLASAVKRFRGWAEDAPGKSIGDVLGVRSG